MSDILAFVLFYRYAASDWNGVQLKSCMPLANQKSSSKLPGQASSTPTSKGAKATTSTEPPVSEPHDRPPSAASATQPLSPEIKPTSRMFYMHLNLKQQNLRRKMTRLFLFLPSLS